MFFRYRGHNFNSYAWLDLFLWQEDQLEEIASVIRIVSKKEWPGQVKPLLLLWRQGICLCLRMCFGLQPLIAWIPRGSGKGECVGAAGQN